MTSMRATVAVRRSATTCFGLLLDKATTCRPRSWSATDGTTVQSVQRTSTDRLRPPSSRTASRRPHASSRTRKRDQKWNPATLTSTWVTGSGRTLSSARTSRKRLSFRASSPSTVTAWPSGRAGGTRTRRLRWARVTRVIGVAVSERRDALGRGLLPVELRCNDDEAVDGNEPSTCWVWIVNDLLLMSDDDVRATSW